MLLILASPADAFRCGNKLVKEGLSESEVITICGEPTSRRNRGLAVRHVDVERGRGAFRTKSSFPLTVEVLITEFVYDLGPRKLMRRLTFEDGLLVNVETLGYGSRKK